MLCGIAQRILDRLFDWSELAFLPSISGLSFSDILLVIGIVVGGILILWGVWESKRQKVPTRIDKTLQPLKWIKGKLGQKPEYSLAQFDDSFRQLKETTQPKTRAIKLDYFQPKLRSLCYDYHWNNEVKDRIMSVLEDIPKSLSEEPNINYYLQFLGMMIHRYGNTISIIKEKFLHELENLYDDIKFETNGQVLSLLQELHEYNEQYMMQLINDAITRWSDQRFQSLGGSIELWELKRKDKEAHQRVVDYISRRMGEAEREDEKTWRRLKKLHELGNR